MQNFRKIAGIALMIFATLLIFLLVIYSIFMIALPEWRSALDGSSFLGLAIMILIAAYLFYKGRLMSLKKNPVAKATPLPLPDETPDETGLRVTVKMKQAEFVKLNFMIAYTKPVFLIITGLGIIFPFIAIDLMNGDAGWSNSYTLFLISAMVLIYLPFKIYQQSVKTLKTNKFVSESITYLFSHQIISVKGESISVRMDWSGVRSIREYKNWFIIYTEQNRGYFIPKNQLAPEEQQQLKALLAGVDGVEKKLK